MGLKLKEEIIVPQERGLPKAMKSPWFWVAAGVVAIGAGGGIYYATRPDIYPGTANVVFGLE